MTVNANTHAGGAGRALTARFNDALIAIRAHLARRRTYRQTVSELSALSDRELADLGIYRQDIHALAHQAAYEL